MLIVFVIFIAALLFALALTPLCRSAAIRRGFLDHPDRTRKMHSHPIPRVGGVAVVLAFISSVLLFLPLSAVAGSAWTEPVWKLLPAAVLVFAIGFLDDLLNLTPTQKLCGQILAALMVFAAGVRFSGIGPYQFPLWCALPATVLWIVGCSNAFNLIDGMDGLAAGVGFFATVTMLLSAVLQHNLPLALATAPLAGALLGFLRYNFNPATIFLGDCGSLLIGFLLGCYSLIWTSKSATALGMTAPVIALTIPLLDTSLSILRRFLRSQPILAPDRGHIHHRLLARGLTPRRAVLLIYGVCGVSAGVSLLVSVAHDQLAGVAVLVFCIGVWLAIAKLGYVEFDAARKMVLGGTFRRLLDAEIRIASFQDNLAAAATPDQCWRVLRGACSDFGFTRVQWNRGHTCYSDRAHGPSPANGWTIRIHLSETEHVDLSREFDDKAPPLIGRFADTIVAELQAKNILQTDEPAAMAQHAAS